MYQRLPQHLLGRPLKCIHDMQPFTKHQKHNRHFVCRHKLQKQLNASKQPQIVLMHLCLSSNPTFCPRLSVLLFCNLLLFCTFALLMLLCPTPVSNMVGCKCDHTNSGCCDDHFSCLKQDPFQRTAFAYVHLQPESDKLLATL